MIKELNKKHVDKIIKLHRMSLVPFRNKLTDKHKYSEEKEYILDTIKKGKIFGYFEKDKLIASGGIAIYRKYDYGEIRHVFVHPSYQRKGIGRKMINKIQDYAKKRVKTLRLNVLIKNPAVKFYEKLGYQKWVYIMKKRLK